MKKIAFLALHLGYGGVEKAITSQANMLSKKYNVQIISTYKLYDKPPFEINKNVKVNYLLRDDLKPNKYEIKCAIKEKNIFKLLKEGIKSLKILYLRTSEMKKAVRECDADIIISSRVLYNKLLTKNRKPGTICIAQEHNHHKNNEKYISKIIKSVRDMDYFMPVSKELTDFYKARIKKAKCVYIPHSLDLIPEIPSNLINKNIISIGRLSKEKGFLDLIEVFSKVSEKNPQWILNIVGDGEEKETIEKKVIELNLQDKVLLHGYQNKNYINKLLVQTSIYVMTSFEESFGIVLLEAQSFGIPCLAFDSARGATEVIKNQENGYLIENRDKVKMANLIEKLIECQELRNQLGKSGRENSYNYSPIKIQKEWFNFIEDVGGYKC